MSMKIVKTYQFRIKDSTSKKLLIQMSRDVNFVWNYCNELARKRWKESRSITVKSDLNKITRGASTVLRINQQSIQAVSYELLTRLKQEKKRIRFRSKKSLGWIPFNGQTIKICGDQIIYNKKIFSFWKSRIIPSRIKTGSFCQDSRGRWYLNLVVFAEEVVSCGGGAVGIDLGLINSATDSYGLKLKTRYYRKFEKQLARFQRAGKKKQAKKIHAKIKNKRKDDIEKATTNWALNNKLIFVGDVNSSALIKSKLAKSTLDASWYMIKARLLHKTMRYGGNLIIVNEAYTSKTCSHCKILWNFPKGLKSLAIREYICPGCHVGQDRDVNAARNILRIGRDSLQTVRAVGEESPTIIALAN
jgi:putative transposase